MRGGNSVRDPDPHVILDGRGPAPNLLADRLRASGTLVMAGAFAVESYLQFSVRQAHDVIVVIRDHPVSHIEVRDLFAAGLRHLPLTITDRWACVGPLVIPGQSACLRCVEYAWSDQDVSWSLSWGCGSDRVLQPVAGVGSGSPLTPLATEVGVAVALAALHDAAPVGVSLEVTAPWPRTAQRLWPVHPRCQCTTASLAA